MFDFCVLFRCVCCLYCLFVFLLFCFVNMSGFACLFVTLCFLVMYYEFLFLFLFLCLFHNVLFLLVNVVVSSRFQEINET